MTQINYQSRAFTIKDTDMEQVDLEGKAQDFHVTLGSAHRSME